MNGSSEALPSWTMPEGNSPIEFLRPQSLQHDHVLQYVKRRLKYSHSRMSQFYPRWRMNEHMLQAYISLKDYENLLEGAKKDKQAPALSQINVPFAWAQVNTIVTYLLHMFAGRKPMFTVGSYRAEQVARAKNIEQLLQYNSDFKRLARSIYFFLMDGETYGVSIMRTLWTTEQRTRTVIIPPAPELVQLMGQLGGQAAGTPTRQSYVSFEGNTCDNVDPFMFFPDPRVPMHEVAEKGEWVAWRAYEGRHILLREEAAGRLRWVKNAGAAPRDDMSGNDSLRGMRALGDSMAGQGNDYAMGIGANYQVDQGTFEVSDRELGLGKSEVPRKWLITVLNGTQIVQCEPIETPHGRHPVVVAEPNSVGYAFGQLGTVDFIGPMQELMSWFMSSHVDNVRTAINNMLVVDPTKVEMKDLERPGPGKIIRTKNSAFGLSDPKSAVYQLPVVDVTGRHINDSQMFARMASDLTGVSDNMRGLQDSGGRKTATEIRTSSEAGSSRLAAKGKVYSSMAFTQLAEMWTLNYQSYLSMEFEMGVLGESGRMDSIRITPDNIQGDFFFPVHDGTLPMDKIGLLDVWREIFMGLAQANPAGMAQVAQNFDLVKMFEWMAQLGGAQNIQSFKLNTVMQSEQQEVLASGQGVPLDAAIQGLASAGAM